MPDIMPIYLFYSRLAERADLTWRGAVGGDVGSFFFSLFLPIDFKIAQKRGLLLPITGLKRWRGVGGGLNSALSASLVHPPSSSLLYPLHHIKEIYGTLYHPPPAPAPCPPPSPTVPPTQHTHHQGLPLRSLREVFATRSWTHKKTIT